MLFEGNAKSRRNINLGTRSSADAHSLLRQTLHERSQRESEKLRLDSATKISALSRRFLLKCRIQRELLQHVNGIIALESTTITTTTNATEQYLFLLRFAVFFTPDIQKLIEIAYFLDKHANLEIISKDHLHLIVRYFRIIWKNLSPPFIKHVTGKLSPIIPRPVLLHSDSNFYSCLRRFILLYGYNDDLNSLLMISFMDENSLYLDDFALEILTIPLLLNRLGVSGVKKLSPNIPFETLILRLANTLPDFLHQVSSRSITENTFTYEGQTALLSNIVALAQARIPKFLPIVLEGFCKIILILIESVPPFFSNSNMGTILEESEDEDGESVQAINNVDPKLAYWLKMTYSQTFIGKLVTMISEVAFDQMELFAITLISIHEKFADSQDAILNGLLYTQNGNSIRRLYKFFECSTLFRLASSSHISSEVLETGSYSKSWYMLALIVESLVRLLYTYGHEEFYSDNNLFGLDNLVEFSRSVKHIAFMMYTVTYSSSKKSMMKISNTRLEFLKTRAIFTKFLQQIHLRDSYRQFFPDNFWPIDHHLNLNVILRDYMKAAQEAKVSSNELDVIEHIPFVISFDERVLLFHEFTYVADDSLDFLMGTRKSYQIRRDHVFEDGFAQLNTLGANLKKKIRITFLSSHGYEEAGIDGGGLFKDFLTELCKEAFDMETGLFVENKEHLLYPNPSKYATTIENLQHFEFLGRMIGKAILEGILLENSFARFFIGKWMGRASYLEELPSLDEELYKNLTFLKNYTGDAEELSLNFTLVNTEFGENKVIELVPGGKDIAVTNQNKIRYIYSVAYYKLNTQISLQTNAFLKGLYEIVDPKLLEMFSQKELHMLVSGVDSKIDVEDLKKNTLYSGPYDENNTVIQTFWELLAEFTDDERKKFLRFATSCSRPPLLGFKQLEPKFGIRHPGNDTDRLPSASTCFNLLKLPPYQDKATMKKKLIYAINSAAGFELS